MNVVNPEESFCNSAVDIAGKHILFVTHASEIGGAERCLLGIMPDFAVSSAVRLFTDGPLRTQLEAVGVQVLYPIAGKNFAAIKRDRSLIRALPQLGALVATSLSLARDARRYDVLYANSQKAFVISTLASVMARRPLIWHLHDIMDRGHFGGAQVRLTISLANWCARGIIVPSAVAGKAFVKAGGRESLVHVVPNGVTLDAAESPMLDRQEQRRRLGLPDGFVFGVFSRLAPWKGQEVALHAAAAIPDSTCVIVGGALFGEDEYAHSLHTLAQDLGIAARVKFLGHQDHREVLSIMHAMDAMVHPSVLPEPFGLTLIEAMLVGIPIVAANSGAVPEILDGGRAGLLVTPGEPRALAEALRELMQNSALNYQLVHAAQARARQHYGVQVMVQKIKQIIADCGS